MAYMTVQLHCLPAEIIFLARLDETIINALGGEVAVVQVLVNIAAVGVEEPVPYLRIVQRKRLRRWRETGRFRLHCCAWLCIIIVHRALR